MKRSTLFESAVPSGRLARLASLGKLASGVAGAMVTEGVRQLASGKRPHVKDLLLTPANIQRLTEQLAQMRGAAMKVGQLLSMDGGDLLPPEFTKILSQLRSDARPMPRSQLVTALNASWGKGWESKFKSFSYTPIAAASIGQVHSAVLHDGRQLAIKVQYPGVRESIGSDIDNLAGLLRVSNMIPRGLDISPLLEEAKVQLQNEADYLQESDFIKQYQRVLGEHPDFLLPQVNDELSTKDVLAMSLLNGESLETLKTAAQSERDRVMSRLFELMFREMFEFNYMQTDPNFANYLYAHDTGKIILLDFGATRIFDAQRMTTYRQLMTAGMANNLPELDEAARKIGYYSTDIKPSQKRLVLKILMLAHEPLRHSGPYPCGRQGLGNRMNECTKQLAADRSFAHLAPTDALFLHRKIGGLYALAVQLRARVDLGKLFSSYSLTNTQERP
jgi:predicted unusual protein kinase regulating ubiquinone biosynthesis (AarF/ABC1/UbiB family)